MQADQDRPIDLTDFTEEVSRVSGEDASALTRRGNSEDVDLLLRRADDGKSPEYRTHLAEKIKELPESLRGISSEYLEQVTILQEAQLLEEDPESGLLGCRTIDGNFAPLPDLEEIVDKLLSSQDVEDKAEQGFQQLLLVPFGMRFGQLENGYKHVLAEHLRMHGMVITAGGSHVALRTSHLTPSPDEGEPIERRYGFKYVSAAHGELTKDALLERDAASAWRIFLAEDPTECDLVDLPAQSNLSHQRIEAGRGKLYPVRDASTTPKEFRKALRHTVFAGEQGMDLETYYVLAMRELQRHGRVLDTLSRTVLLGSYHDNKKSTHIERYCMMVSFDRQPGRIMAYEPAEDDLVEAGIRTVVEVV